jgi:predicted transcriptional regulator
MKRLNAKRSHVAELLDSHATDLAQGQLSVSELMTPSPLSIDPTTNMLEILRIFHKKQVRHLLVLDSDGRLLGIVSERDVLRCFSPGLRPSEKYLTGIPPPTC